MTPVDKAQYQLLSYIGRASSSPHKGQTSSLKYDSSWAKPNINSLLILEGHRHPIQGPGLFIKVWHQLGKAQYQFSSCIGRASSSPHKVQASLLRNGTSWAKPNIKPLLILEGSRYLYTRASPLY
ncbi:hypothetical protein Adt_22871 [Abeliophyllum distichum]|uniref:Uncharacterized protein n=1 Tax=Abeliophyllum distichum TaxID=126358 RepID=A0ABD1S9H9_9LAMI